LSEERITLLGCLYLKLLKFGNQNPFA
jgi:hypothetical protein